MTIHHQPLFDMKTLLSLAAFLFCSQFLLAQTLNDEADMHTFAREFMAAYNSGDRMILRSMYTDDAVRIDPEGQQMEGADQIIEFFGKQFRSNNATLLIRQEGLSWSDAEQAWLSFGTYHIYGRSIVYDMEIDLQGTYANAMVKDGDTWKIAKSVLSAASDNVSVINGLYQAFAEGNIEAAMAPMSADIIWNEAEGFPYADRNPYEGPDAVLEGVFARIGAEWEYWNLTDIQLHEVGDNMVLATLRYDAKHLETGKVLDAQTAHLWTLDNGQIVGFQQYTDTQQANEVMR